MKFLLVIIVLFIFSGCDHPENKAYERNKGTSGDLETLTTKKKGQNLNSEEKISDQSLSVENESSNILKMENQNGVKYVWIEINDIKLRFIFDTGASSISISPVEASLLYRQGTLRKEDILDKEYFQDATGKISEGTKVNLRTVKVGNRTLENVQATVVDNVNAPLLLGQSVLENFGSIEIDNNNNLIILR